MSTDNEIKDKYFQTPVKDLSTIVLNNRGGAKFKTSIPKEELHVLSERGKGLYIWVFEEHYKSVRAGISSPKIKYGQYGANSVLGTLPQETIDGYLQVTTSPVVILWVRKFEEEDDRNPYNIEQKVRNNLKSDGIFPITDANSTEVYPTTPTDVIERVSSIMDGSKKLDTFLPRIPQKEFINLIKHNKKSGESDTMLAAIMRYGKNFAWLTSLKELIDEGYYEKNSVFMVLTSKPKVFSSLKEDIEKHVFFKDWNYYELKDEKKTVELVNSDTPTVIAVSTQLAFNLVSGKKTVNFLYSIDFDDVFIDECHSGTNTENFERFNQGLNTKHRTWASGTPLKTIVNRGFLNNQTYFYGYIDQQRDKRKDIENGIPNDSVTLETLVPVVRDEVKNNPLYTEDEQFSLTKLFAVDDKSKQFVFEGDVEKVFKDILGKTKSKFSPFRLRELLNHTVWLLPNSVNVAKAATEMLERLTDDDTKVLCASGSDGVTDIDEVKKAINDYKKTITITIGRFKEGTTVPQWRGAFVLSQTKSVETYFQFIFRVGSPFKNKDKAYVFDFSPERSFEMVFEMSKSHAIVNEDNDIKSVTKEWLDFNNVYINDTGPNFREVDISEIMSQINDGDYRAQTLKSSAKSWIDVDKLKDIKDKFSELDIDSNSSKVSKKFISNEMEGGKDYKLHGKGNPTPTDKEISDVQKAFDNVKNIVSALPFIADTYDVDTVKEVSKVVEPDFFKEMTQVDKRYLDILLNNGVLNEMEINYYL